MLGVVRRTVEGVERASRRGTGRIRIWRRRWRVTRRETTANAHGRDRARGAGHGEASGRDGRHIQGEA